MPFYEMQSEINFDVPEGGDIVCPATFEIEYEDCGREGDHPDTGGGRRAIEVRAELYSVQFGNAMFDRSQVIDIIGEEAVIAAEDDACERFNIADTE